jgi:ribokinase
MSELYSSVLEKTSHGGGSIRGYPQLDIKGGNAVNVGYCLAKLGVKVNLFTVADQIGSSVLRKIFSQFNDRANLKISEGEHGLTTVFEFLSEKGQKVNIMLGHLGDTKNFGPEKINSQEHLDILAKADAVIIVNWGSNMRGNELMNYVFKNCNPKALRFIDPADIELRRVEFYNSLKKLSHYIDVLSINENELNSLMKCIKLNDFNLSKNFDKEYVKNIVRFIARDIQINVDLHTVFGSFWSDGDDCVFVPSFRCSPITVTGAGDSWDSADIFGYLAELDPATRLLVANAYSSIYISNLYSEPGTLDDLEKYLKNNPIQK